MTSEYQNRFDARTALMVKMLPHTDALDLITSGRRQHALCQAKPSEFDRLCFCRQAHR